MKRKRRRFSEVEITSSSTSLSISPSLRGRGDDRFSVRLPCGAGVAGPAGFDADELLALLFVVQEALT